MPIYEYECEKCGAVFEMRQKFSDEPLTIHDKCGGAVRRLISAPALQFKGTGWYVTDYARGSGGGNGSKKSSGENKPSPDSASESKPAESKPAETKPSAGDKSKKE